MRALTQPDFGVRFILSWYGKSMDNLDHHDWSSRRVSVSNTSDPKFEKMRSVHGFNHRTVTRSYFYAFLLVQKCWINISELQKICEKHRESNAGGQRSLWSHETEEMSKINDLSQRSFIKLKNIRILSNIYEQGTHVTVGLCAPRFVPDCDVILPAPQSYIRSTTKFLGFWRTHSVHCVITLHRWVVSGEPLDAQIWGDLKDFVW